MKKLVLLSLLTGCLAFLSCNSDELSGNARINDWIYVNMDYYYYWTDDMPRKTGLNQYPADFYESILSEQDRFSFIYDDYEVLLGLLGGISLESGFEFKLYSEEGSSTNVIMQLVYIKPNSPAATLGLQRGDIIYQINGTQFTTENYRTLLDQMNTTYTASYRRYNSELNQFQNQAALNITPVVYAENPIYLYSVIEAGGKKIGYLVYNFFAPGTNGSYDDAVDDVFAGFKTADIDELIVDLRFNGGGSVASALNLASLLAEGVTTNDVALKLEYNDKLTQDILNDPLYGAEYFIERFLAKSENVGSLMGSGKIHFIVTDRTASASEMVINAILPYMDTYLVGETTVGKDVGSITLYDETLDWNRWALQPIILKIVNSENADYPSGFTPDISLPDDFLVLKPLGDINEPLLNATLGAIGVLPARMDPSAAFNQKPLYESIDSKKWNRKMLADEVATFQPMMTEE